MQKNYSKPFLIPVVFSLGLFYFTIRLWGGFIKGNETRHWKKTTGIIVYNQIEETTKSSIRGVNVTHVLRLKYNYSVEEYTYIGTTISYKSQDTSKEGAIIAQKNYPTDEQVDVYYNPENPEKSVLEQGSDIRLPIVISIINAVFILLSFYLWRRSILKKKHINK